MKKVIVSIIIPVYNEEEDIADCLNSLFKQSYKNFEIIVADDGSTDKTISIVRKFKKVKILKQKHKGPGVARNLGAGKAVGKILVFLDADMTFDKNYLKNLILPLKDKKIIGTVHYEIAKNLDNIWSRCWGKVSKPDNQKETYTFKAIRKKDFMKMGGFDLEYGYADDWTFFFKHGVKSRITEKAICYHKNPETLKHVYRQSRWIGSSIDNIWFKIPLIKYIAPIFLICLSPIAILFLSLKKCYKNKLFYLFPYMLVFMMVRYFGSIEGLFRKIYFGKNIR